MKNEEMILNPVGQAFEELTLEEMVASQGSGDVKTETTVPCSAVSIELSIKATTIAYSYYSKKC